MEAMEIYTITGMSLSKECGMLCTAELDRRATALYTSLGKARKAMEEIASRYRECLPEDKGSSDSVVGVNFGLFAEAEAGVSELGRVTVHFSEDSEYILEKVWILEKHKLRT